MITTILTALVLVQASPQDLYQFDYIQAIDSYSVNLDEGDIYFTIIPQKGYKWDKTYNAKLKLKRSHKVKLSQRHFSNKKKDFSQGLAENGDKTITVVIPYKNRTMDDYAIKGTISFRLCNKTTCKLQKNVKVKIWIYGEGC